MKKTKEYVNNADFTQALIDYKTASEEAKRLGKPKPKIPNYIGECWMKIAENFSHKPNFINYPHREEMVSDGIENCLMYFENFDPNKSKNPFAYFSQVVFYAFLRRIDKEKKQLYVKYKSTEMIGVLDEHDQNDFEDGTSRQFQLYDNIGEFISTYEKTKKAKLAKTKKKAKGLEKFIKETPHENV